jgi:hypothetical protein
LALCNPLKSSRQAAAAALYLASMAVVVAAVARIQK